MSEIVNRYTQALFSVSLEAHEAQQTMDQLRRFQGILNDTEIRSFFSTAQVNHLNKLSVLDAGDFALGNTVLNFIKVLVKNNRITEFDDIVQAYQAQLYDYQNILVAKVTSAMDLNEESYQELKKSLESRFKATVILEVEVDEALIQGLKIRINGQELDNSLSSRLDELSRQLKKGEYR